MGVFPGTARIHQIARRHDQVGTRLQRQQPGNRPGEAGGRVDPAIGELAFRQDVKVCDLGDEHGRRDYRRLLRGQ